uniref:Uncharacterized protein n=1 Tax=Opuntia streptacantha TaxID=393608 RepID=A0A7C8YD17_OPUST
MNNYKRIDKSPIKQSTIQRIDYIHTLSTEQTKQKPDINTNAAHICIKYCSWFQDLLDDELIYKSLTPKLYQECGSTSKPTGRKRTAQFHCKNSWFTIKPSDLELDGPRPVASLGQTSRLP